MVYDGDNTGEDATTTMVMTMTVLTTPQVMQSQAVEDENNQQKNSHQVTEWGGRFRRPQTCMFAILKSGFLNKTHRYKTLSSDAPVPASTPALRKEDLVPSHTPDLPLLSVADAKAKAPYFSPQAENVGLPTADLNVARTLEPNGMLADVGCALF